MTIARNGRGHSRDDVTHAAMRILDEFGLPDLTMRRLAAALDVQPSALYWHFPNKQSLLAEVSDRIVAEVGGASDDDDWASRTVAEASALRRALRAHRDGAELVASTLASGLGSGTPHERLGAAIASGGFDQDTVQRATTTLLRYILGQVQHEQQRRQFSELGGAAALPDDPLREDGDFAFGIDLLLDGLRARRDCSPEPDARS